MRVYKGKQKKAVKLAPKDYVKTLIWFFGGFGGYGLPSLG